MSVSVRGSDPVERGPLLVRTGVAICWVVDFVERMGGMRRFETSHKFHAKLGHLSSAASHGLVMRPAIVQCYPSPDYDNYYLNSLPGSARPRLQMPWTRNSIVVSPYRIVSAAYPELT